MAHTATATIWRQTPAVWALHRLPDMIHHVVYGTTEQGAVGPGSGFISTKIPKKIPKKPLTCEVGWKAQVGPFLGVGRQMAYGGCGELKPTTFSSHISNYSRHEPRGLLYNSALLNVLCGWKMSIFKVST